MDFLFSTLYTTPFPCGKIHFLVLHLLRVSIATSDNMQRAIFLDIGFIFIGGGGGGGGGGGEGGGGAG